MIPKEDYMIVLQPVVPMRAEASDCSEMVSQMLFGDSCQVLQRTEGWYRVRTCFDGYLGWVNPKQLTPVTDADVELLKIRFWIAQEAVVPVDVDGAYQMMLPMGAMVPDGTVCIAGHTYRAVRGIGESAPDMTAYATRLMGAPYLWGGRTLMGVDCSGLVQVAARCSGFTLPRDASQQASWGKLVPLSEAVRNDLCFFSNDSGKIIHVGIYLGDGKILHASGDVHIDLLDDKGIYSEKYGRYTHRLHSVKRLVG